MLIKSQTFRVECDECREEFMLLPASRGPDILSQPITYIFDSKQEANYYLPDYGWWVSPDGERHLHKQCWAACND